MTTYKGAMNDNWRTCAVPDGFTVAAVGDIIITHPIYQQLRRESPRLLELLASADVVVGNYEGSAIDLTKYKGYPEAEAGFAWLTSSPDCPADLAKAGFNMLSRANNHTMDWGVEGMRMTDRLIDEAGIAHSGTGESLSAAQAPCFIYGEKANVSLVSWATTFEKNARAIDALGQINARPGLSALPLASYVCVDSVAWEGLLAIRKGQPAASDPRLLKEYEAASKALVLYNQRYVHDPRLNGQTRVHYEVGPREKAGILRNVRQAKQTSDFTIAAQHTHEPDNWSVELPDFMQGLARETIDQGADMFCGHGPHQLRGIEIYNGKPIFYSLGNFTFMDNTQQIVPRDEWEQEVWHVVPNKPQTTPMTMTPAEFLEWKRVVGVFEESLWFESVLALTTYKGGKADTIKLYPLELHWQCRDAERGIPRLADAETGSRILKRLAEISAPFGTRIDIAGEVGIIALHGQDSE